MSHNSESGPQTPHVTIWGWRGGGVQSLWVQSPSFGLIALALASAMMLRHLTSASAMTLLHLALALNMMFSHLALASAMILSYFTSASAMMSLHLVLASNMMLWHFSSAILISEFSNRPSLTDNTPFRPHYLRYDMLAVVPSSNA